VIVEKTATRPERFRRRCRTLASGRAAFAALLAGLKIPPDGRVLLPAYIGWSSREGSGVFDPIRQLDLQADFYRLDRRLRIDLGDLEAKLRSGGVRVLVLIHYFGYVDPGYQQAVALARQFNVFVVEDQAHALLTDLIGGISGRLGDASIFSLHKLLPVAGGMLAVNDWRSDLVQLEPGDAPDCPIWEFDLAEISARRRGHALLWDRLVEPLGQHLEPLWGAPKAGEVPQTYPVLIRPGNRDRLYFALNDAGFGAVSLYHTLVGAIDPALFADSVFIAQRIFNLPVHQDIEPGQLESMAESLKQCLEQAC